MNVTCDCGKRMAVSDALAGKSVRCSACGESIFVAAAPASTGKPKQEESAGIYVSTGMLVAVITVVLLIIAGVAFYFGPVRVSHQWDAMDLTARNTVMHVITFSQKAYLSQKGEFDPLAHAPAIERDGVIFVKPFFSMSMPQTVEFFGSGNNGSFTGSYNTETGEVEADVQAGANVVAGMATLKKATATMHIVAHEVPNADPEVVADGKPLKFVPLEMPTFKHR